MVFLTQGINNWEEMLCFWVMDDIKLIMTEINELNKRTTSSSEPYICWKILFLRGYSLVRGTEKERNRHPCLLGFLLVYWRQYLQMPSILSSSGWPSSVFKQFVISMVLRTICIQVIAFIPVKKRMAQNQMSLQCGLSSGVSCHFLLDDRCPIIAYTV